MRNSGGKLGWEYWVQWQVPVCALIIVVPAVLSVRFIRKSKPEPVILSNLWGSSWRNLNPIWLLLYRAFAFVFLAQLLYYVVVLHGAFVFYFFYTQWTFALVVVYFALGTIVSAYGLWVPSKKLPSENEGSNLLERDLNPINATIPNTNLQKDMKLQRHEYAHDELQQEAGILGNLMQISYLTCAGAVILTDIVFWCLIVPFLTDETFHVDLLMAAMHSLNAVFLIGDTALNRLPFPWSGFTYFALWSCLYVVFQWIVHMSGFFTWWPYPFLELNTPSAPLWYICLALVHVPFYGLYVVIVKAKDSLLSKLFPGAFLRSC